MKGTFSFTKANSPFGSNEYFTEFSSIKSFNGSFGKSSFRLFSGYISILNSSVGNISSIFLKAEEDLKTVNKRNKTK